MAVVERSKKTKYDPSKNYEWQPTDEFTLTGEEFAVLYNTARDQINSPSGISPFLQMRAFDILNRLFVEAVEQGVITEKPEQVQESPPVNGLRAETVAS